VCGGDVPRATFGRPEVPLAGRVWTAQYRSLGVVASRARACQDHPRRPRFPLGCRLAADLRLLAPTGAMFHVTDPAAFRQLYVARLDRIGVDRVQELLHGVRRAHGADVLLLCCEDVRGGRDWCHRLVLAEWWRELTGEPALELLDREP